MARNRFIGPAEIGLMVSIVIALFGGAGYAIFSGVVVVPWIKPATNADLSGVRPRPSTSLPASLLTDPTASPDLLGSVSPVPQAEVSPVASPTPSVEPSGAPAVTPGSASSPSTSGSAGTATVPSPSSASSPSPASDPQAQLLARDEQRKFRDLPQLRVALGLHYDKHKKFPISLAFREGRTDNPSSPLQILVKEGHIAQLPIDPKSPEYWYGYKSVDGKSYTLTARLENTSDPDGTYDENNNYLYSVTISK